MNGLLLGQEAGDISENQSEIFSNLRKQTLGLVFNSEVTPQNM